MPTDVDAVQVRAPAKINLFLRVLAREASGFHQIETLFSAINLSDEIRVERSASGVSIAVSGADVGPDSDNLACRAARAFVDATSAPGGVHVSLTKHIPTGAGLGGGSSDAGATLRALNELFGNPLSSTELMALAGDLGADVPFFASGAGRALGWGRGERLLSLDPAPTLAVLLALPPLQVATPDAYRDLRLSESVKPWFGEPGDLRELSWLVDASENDFEPSVFAQYPELGVVHEGILESGALSSRLSGSGAALFGLFDSRESSEGASETLSRAFPDVRFLATETLGRQPTPERAG